MPSKKYLHLLWIMPLLIILLAGAYAFYRYKTFKKPYLVDVDTDFISPGQGAKAQMYSTFYLVNENNFGLHVDSLNYKVFIDNDLYAIGKQDTGITIKANDTTAITLPYKLDVELFKKNFENTGKDSGLHKYMFDFYVDIWKFNSVHIPYSFEKNSPVVKAPKAEIEKVELKKLGLNETILEATIKLSNPNDVPFSSENLFYSFAIDGNIIAEGEIPQDKFLAKESSITLGLPIKLDLKEAIDEIGILRKKYEGKSYSLRFKANLKSAGKQPPVYDFEIFKTGKMEELVEKFKQERKEKKEEKKEEKREEKKRERAPVRATD